MLDPTWFVTPVPRRQSELRLIGFPYAGGSATSFRHWGKRLSDRLELAVLQLPGRENRTGEPLLRRMDEVVRAVGPLLAAQDRPFVLFGHSVGALMAYELTRWLERQGRPGPRQLIVAGKRAPHVPLGRRPMHELDDRELVDKLRHFNGTPQIVLDTPELLEFFLPRVRADFEINETYRFAGGAGVSCPMTVLGGTTDPDTTVETLLAWREHAAGAFEHHIFPGDHFFVHALEDQVLAEIERVALRGGPVPTWAA